MIPQNAHYNNILYVFGQILTSFSLDESIIFLISTSSAKLNKEGRILLHAVEKLNPLEPLLKGGIT